MTDRPKIAFLGIGLMGRHQAQNLINSGYHLTAWNRTRRKADALKGAVVAETPAEAVAQADIVITMLENGPIVQQVLFEGAACAVSALQHDAVLIDMSSIKPAEARDHAMRLAGHGVRYLDAPVSGGTGGAQTATLAIMAGGAAPDFEAVRPVLDTMGQATHVGPVGSGQLAKLANQMIVGVTIAAVAEALALSAQGGADPAKVRAALMGGFADSRVLSLHGQRMIDRDFETRGRSVTHLKDLDNALATAQELGFHGSLLDRATALFRGLVDHQGDPDHSAVLLEIERINRR